LTIRLVHLIFQRRGAETQSFALFIIVQVEMAIQLDVRGSKI